MSGEWDEYGTAIHERSVLVNQLALNPDLLQEKSWQASFAASVQRMTRAERRVIDLMIAEGQTEGPNPLIELEKKVDRLMAETYGK